MKTYRAFPSIAIPETLQTSKWHDASWHNDECPNSEYVINETEQSVIRVWVRPTDDVEAMEHHVKMYGVPAPRFSVQVSLNNGDDVFDIYEGNSEFAMQCAITAWLLKRFADKVLDL
jgi:hypothetical protein